MSFAMEQDEALDSLQIRLLSANAVVTYANELPYLIEQPWRTGVRTKSRHNPLPELAAALTNE